MIAADEAAERIAEERAALEVRIELRVDLERDGAEEHGLDRKIDFAGLEGVGQPTWRRDDSEIDVGRALPDASEQRRERERVEEVG